MDMRESLNGKGVIPRARPRVLLVPFGAIGVLREVLGGYGRKPRCRLLHDDERGVEHGSANLVDIDPAGLPVEDRGNGVDRVALDDGVEHVRDLGSLSSLGDLVGEFPVNDEFPAEHLLRPLLVVLLVTLLRVAEEPVVLVLRMAVVGVLDERGHRPRRVLLAELRPEERPPRLEPVVVRSVDADTVLGDLRGARVVRRRIPEPDAPRTDTEVHGGLVRPGALLHFVGDDLERDRDDVLRDALRPGLEDGEVPEDELLGRDERVLAEDVPVVPDVHDLRHVLARRVVPDRPLRRLDLLRNDPEKLVRVGIPGDSDRPLEEPEEVELSALRLRPPRGTVPRLRLLLHRLDEVVGEDSVVVRGEPVENGRLVADGNAVVPVLRLGHEEQVVPRLGIGPPLLVLLLRKGKDLLGDLDLPGPLYHRDLVGREIGETEELHF